MSVTQRHLGTGDNIGKNKIIIENYIVNSLDYQNLVDRIETQELLISSLTQINDHENLVKANQKLDQLKEEKQQFKETVFRLNEIFTKYEINTKRVREAKEHFDNGRFREADAVLKVNELVKDQETLLNKKNQKIEELSQLEENLKSNSIEFLIKAQLTTALRYDIPDWFEKTIEYYEEAIKSARTLDNLFEYALFLQKNNRFDTAQSLYKEVLEIYEQLAKINPVAYEADVAMTLNNLAILYQAMNDYPLAETTYKRALEIFERLLTKVNLATYTTLNNLAILYQAKNDYPLAEATYKRALEIFERLTKVNSVAYEPDMAKTLINLAAYEPDVATTLNNLAILYQAKNDYPLAETTYKRALEIFERLTKVNSVAYEPDMAKTLNNMAILYQEKNDYSSAKVYERALEIYELLAKAFAL